MSEICVDEEELVTELALKATVELEIGVPLYSALCFVGDLSPLAVFMVESVKLGIEAIQTSSTLVNESSTEDPVQQKKHHLLREMFSNEGEETTSRRAKLVYWTMFVSLEGYETDIWKRTKDVGLVMESCAEKIADFTIEEMGARTAGLA